MLLDIHRTPPVAKEPQKSRIDLRVSESFIARVEEAARRKQLPVSAYIRMAISDRMDADQIPQPKKPKKE